MMQKARGLLADSNWECRQGKCSSCTAVVRYLALSPIITWYNWYILMIMSRKPCFKYLCNINTIVTIKSRGTRQPPCLTFNVKRDSMKNKPAFLPTVCSQQRIISRGREDFGEHTRVSSKNRDLQNACSVNVALNRFLNDDEKMHYYN